MYDTFHLFLRKADLQFWNLPSYYYSDKLSCQEATEEPATAPTEASEAQALAPEAKDPAELQAGA